MSPVSQAQIASLLGVSRSAVSAVLSGSKKARISDETAKRILSTARKLNYKPNRYALIMRKGKTGLIGILHKAGLLQSAYERLIFASQAVHQAGHRLMVLDPSWFAGRIDEAEAAFVEARAEGVIVSGVSRRTEDSGFQLLQEASVPYVVLCARPVCGVSQVRCDVRGSFLDLTRLLLDNGRRRLSLLVSPHTEWPGSSNYYWSTAERVAGFRAAIEERGGSIYSTNLSEAGCSSSAPTTEESPIQGEIVVCTIDKRRIMDSHQFGYHAMEILLRRASLPEGVMCSNDDWAIGALFACSEAGVSVPDDLAITGFDNASEGLYSTPPLTTVSQPNELMARHAVDLLLQKIKNHTVSDSCSEWLGKVVVRKSCGTARSDDYSSHRDEGIPALRAI